MKTIGLIGGMSWESTVPYYSFINKEINRILGRNHSAKIVLYSFDFETIERMQYENRWEDLRHLILEAGLKLKNSGADFAVLCTNTMHKVVDNFEREVGIPLLHIAQAVGEAVCENAIKRVGLLGTIFTMEENFYRKVLEEVFQLAVIIPEKKDRMIVNSIIYEELVKGIIREESRKEYERIMREMKDAGAEAVILGCTEIGLLVKEFAIPIFDSTLIHAHQAVKLSLTQ